MNLTEIKEKIDSAPFLENKMDWVNAKLSTLESEVNQLLSECEKENKDVERMKNTSLSSFLLKLFGKYEDRLDKEKREEMLAKLNYDKVASEIDYLNKTKAEIDERLRECRELSIEYNQELLKRRLYIENNFSEKADEIGIKYWQLEDERQALTAQKREVSEAIREAKRTSDIAQRALTSLSKADDWASYDLWTRGGLLTHAMKYSHIDDAENLFNDLKHQVKILKAELEDVQDLDSVAFSEISSSDRTIDFWFDNIFTDLSVRDQIRDNINDVNKFLGNLNKLETKLNDKLSHIEKALETNKSNEEKLLITLHLTGQMNCE